MGDKGGTGGEMGVGFDQNEFSVCMKFSDNK